MTLSIIFHGTGDTQYETDRAYLIANKLDGIGEGSHTLSFFADCIAMQAEQDEEPLFSKVAAQHKDPHLLKISNELVIIQGADDTGTEVHNLIVSGLMAALNGIARGERNLFFFGFSRGSVEAIHMTHELQRIKDYVNHPDSDLSPQAFYTFICEHCYNPGALSKWRTNRIKNLYKEALLKMLQDPDRLQCLIEGLQAPDLNLNGKLLDPVPGLCEGNPWLYVPWTNLAHHTMIAAMVKELQIAYMDSEFSVGFRAVWVEAAEGSDTQVIRYPLPGFHSTANGNPVNHKPNEALSANPPFPFEKTRDVQKVFFYKLLQFADKHHIPLKPPTEVADRFLSPIFQHYITHRHDITAQNEFLRQHYKEIARNLEVYRKTRETCYIPSILGGLEHTEQERKLMTKSGERSMADCFSFDFKGAKSYPNFESWALDFMTTFFPELDAPLSNPNRAFSYDGITPILQARYAPSSQEIDCGLLHAKITGLLDASRSHQLEGALNTLLLEGLDRDSILDNLSDLVPAKLANSFYSSNLTPENRAHVQNSIDAILKFVLPILGEEEQSVKHQTLYEQKNRYMLKFQKNMLDAIVAQTHTYLVDLLGAAEQFQQRAANQKEDLTQDDAQPFDANEYLIEAEQCYQSLLAFQDKLRFSIPYLELADQPRLQYKIEETIAQFPGICERVLQKHGIDFNQATRFDFTVMQPLNERLAQERALQEQLNQNAATIATLNLEKATAIEKRQEITLVLEQIEARQAIYESQVAADQAVSRRDLAALTQRLNTIQNTLSAYKNHQFSGFTYMLLGGLSIIIGTIITAIAAYLLILGTGSMVLPIMALGISTGMTFFGMTASHIGATRRTEEILSNTFFPENR